MSTIKVKLKKLEHFDENLPLPSYQTNGSAGADIRACLGRGEKLIIKPGQRTLVPTGLTVEVPMGYEMQIRPRSGLSFKTGLMVVNSPGTVDSDYRGEVKIIIGNLGLNDEEISHGDRIAQILFSTVTIGEFEISDELTSTDRGIGGFGSTGRS